MDKYAKVKKELAASDVGLKRAPLPLLALIFLTAFLTLTSASTNAETQMLSSANIKVNHVLEIRKGGLLIINDTVSLFANSGENVSLNNFLIGFPSQYRYNLDYCFAYDFSKPEELMEVVLDSGLGKIGFYGVNVKFREPVDISDGKSFSFTVVFVFSNLMKSWVPKLEPDNALFNVSFPMFPSLTQSISLCNVTIILPSPSLYIRSHLQDEETDFNRTEVGSRTILNYVQSPLENFAYEPSWLEFVQVAPSTREYLLMFDVNEIKRDIKLDEWGGILVSDTYDLTNRAVWNLTSITTHLPRGAYNIYVRDASGNIHHVEPEERNETRYVDALILLGTELKEGNTTKFTITYSLPWREYINHQSTSNFQLSFHFFEYFNLTVRKLVTTITLPKGANFRSSSVNPDIVEKNVFQGTVTFTFYNVTPFHDLNFDLIYEHFIFWESFYPTLWMGVLVAIVCASVLLWRRAPRPPTVPTIPISIEILRSFVDAYEKKTKISSELESIEELLRRGKIPRRRYKVRKKTLEGRLSTLFRELSSLREKIRVAGPRYANMMGQVEVAEDLLEGVKRDIRRVEARYRHGEISKGAYRRLIAEYERRRERARTTIEGVLIRLREEIR